MKRVRLFVHVGLALVGAAVVAAASMTLVRAFNPQPDPPGDAYALIGLLRQQTIEITVSNYGMPGQGFPPGPCRGSMALYDMNGDVVQTQDFSLPFGRSASLNFTVPAPVVNGDVTGELVPAVRTYLRAGVSFRKAGGEQVGRAFPPDPCISGVSVIGAEGGTSLVQSPGAVHGILNGNHNETLVIDGDN